MKKYLLLFLLFLLLPYPVFATGPMPGLQTHPAQVKKVKVNTGKIPKNAVMKNTSNAAMKILSFTCKASSTGDWILLYESINPGLVNFAAHQLQYKLTRILRNGSRSPIHITTNRRAFLHGTRIKEHSLWDRCSLTTKVGLEISYKNKVLDKKIINVPAMNVKIVKAYGLNGRFSATLKNNTSHVAKVGVRTIAMDNPNHSSLAVVSGDRLLGPEIQVVIPGNSTKTCSGNIVKGGENASIQVMFKDEKKCAGQGYIILASKLLTRGFKQASNKFTQDLPKGLQNGLPKMSFQIVNETLVNSLGLNRTFTVYFDFSRKVDPATMGDSVVEFYLRSYQNNHYVAEQRLTGKWENTTGKDHLRWKTSPLSSSFPMVNYAAQGNYLQIDVSVHSTVKSENGELLDGDADGTPGGWPYKHKFYIGK